MDLIGPYFFDNHLNGETYLSFLQNKLPELLEEIDLATKNVVAARWCATSFSSYCDGISQ